MLFDMHAHTKGISKCCRVEAEEIVKRAKNAGIGGIVLTNHYTESYVTDGDYEAFARRYVEEFHKTKRLGEEIGVTVVFGIELTMEFDPAVHLLIYGVPEEFIIKNPTIFNLTQKELYTLVRENGGALVQAHPYRNNTERLLDTDYLDGIEISCHPLYEGTHISKLSPIAYNAGLILTVGGDYHADTRRPKCGMYIDEEIAKNSLPEYIRSAKSVELMINEVDTEDTYTITFVRKQG